MYLYSLYNYIPIFNVYRYSLKVFALSLILNLTVILPVRKFPYINGILRFITVFTTSHKHSLLTATQVLLKSSKLMSLKSY